MDFTDPLPKETFWLKDSFRFIKTEDFKALGIDPTDIPLGTFAAFKHPSQLRSRFGGNAYGLGLSEDYDRLKPKDFKLLQAVTFDSPEEIKKHYRRLNEIYKRIGLLIRLSSQGNPYYLIPVHLISNTLTQIKARVDEISKIIGFHRKKFLKEHHEIGILTHQDDLVPNELSFRFKEHNFVVIDSLEKVQQMNRTLDIIILTRDLYEIILMRKFSSLSQDMFSRKRLDQYAVYVLWKVYNLLKPDGEIFIIADYITPKTNQTTNLVFNITREEKNFILFSHLFKTRKDYKACGHAIQVNIFDFQKYLSGLYVEHEVVDKLLGGKELEEIELSELNNMPYIDFNLSDVPFLSNQEKSWTRLLSIYFDKIFLKPLLPQSVTDAWGKRFHCPNYTPNYMLIYLGQKKGLTISLSKVMRDVKESSLRGCPTELSADYRDSFNYVIQTLRVLNKLKNGGYEGPQQIYIGRLKQPLENKNRRFSALNDVIKLMSKIDRLEDVRDYLNPDGIEGLETKVFENLEALTFFGFNHNELKEIVCIVLGHTPLGRIISGKMNEKSLKPLSDLARTYNLQQALNLLRYCRLMTIAEMEAARGAELTHEEFTQLFDLYESTVRIVTNRELDWDILLDEKITSVGGIHNKIVWKLLMMTHHFEFIENWAELRDKGRMEKESLADYEDQRLSRIENVIKLVNIIDLFEERHLKSDPLQLPVFYRKFLDIEFHGTGRLFEKMDSRNVFILLWCTVNLSKGEVINFNPVLAASQVSEIDDWVKKIEKETNHINIDYLGLPVLSEFSEQLYQNKSSFIMDTGFQLKVDSETQALEIAYMDLDKNIEQLESLSRKLTGCRLSEISIEELSRLEKLFSNLESFHQSHLRVFNNQILFTFKLPSRQKQWFNKVQNIRHYLKSNYLSVMFHPENVYTDLDLLYRHAPSLLNFILPEFMALQNLDLSWRLYLNFPVTDYIINATSKLQALINHDRESFQDSRLSHRLAQREFGPMATGIIGVSESQIEELEKIIDGLSLNQPLFDSLIKSFIFQDLGRVPFLRKKYKDEINPAALGKAGAFFFEKEKIAERYNLDEKSKFYLAFLIKHHSLLHHILRGELSFYSIQSILDPKEKDLFDASFILSFIMLCAIREDLLFEDIAGRLIEIRIACQKIIAGETTLKAHLDEIFVQKGALFYALENYQTNGLPEGVSPSDYLESPEWSEIETKKRSRAGKRVFALERFFHLRGIRYVEVTDLVYLMLKAPLKFIYKKRNLASIGYATFERETFEAFRIYNTFRNLADEVKYVIFDKLIGDKVRLFGYEKVSGYLSYENQIKLLLVGLMGTQKFKPDARPIFLDFLGMSEMIEKRYEALNDYLNSLSIKKLWEDKYQLNHFFKAKSGIILKKERFTDVLSVNFQDRINITQKISYMDNISNMDQLKNYFHYSLRSLRKYPFYTDDYELELETGFEKKRIEITDNLLEQAKKQMGLIKNFEELHNLVNDLLERSWDIGLSYDQKQRLNDLYELRKNGLTRDKLLEFDSVLDTIHDALELKDYWDSIKWYLQHNRRFFGKEFENLIAKKFDATRRKEGY